MMDVVAVAVVVAVVVVVLGVVVVAVVVASVSVAPTGIPVAKTTTSRWDLASRGPPAGAGIRPNSRVSRPTIAAD